MRLGAISSDSQPDTQSGRGAGNIEAQRVNGINLEPSKAIDSGRVADEHLDHSIGGRPNIVDI